MKRVILTLLGLAVITTCAAPAHAGLIADKKTQIIQAKIEKNTYKDIESLFTKQDELVSKYDTNGLKNLYSEDFINSDGFNKDVYFSLIEDTWSTYPDITYKTYIKGIKVTGNYATVDTFETAVATTGKDADLGDSIGELHSTSNCRYHLEKLSGKWLITGEDILDESSTLKFGDARYVKMDLTAPSLVSAGKPYTATLKVDLPSDRIVIASINQEKIVNPSSKSEEKFRRLPDDQILERMFTANSDNLNEYTIASVGIAKTEPVSFDNIRVYMNGLAFIMTRVNVVPKNNFAKIGDK